MILISLAQIHEKVMEGILHRKMKNIPILLPLLIPLAELTDLIAHKVQFFARVSEHVRVQGPGLRKLLFIIAGHLLNDRRLSMHHFIVRQRKQIVFIIKILHGEGELMIILRTIRRIRPEIVQRIVHPAHVPLIVEPESALRNRLRYPRIGGGILRDEHNLRMALLKSVVHTADKFDGIRVHTASLISLPVNQISDCIKSKSIEMIHADPEIGSRVQEGAHIPAGVAEIAAAPLTVADRLVRILVQMSAVVLPEAEIVHRKMYGHHIKDHTDICCMKLINQLLQPVRLSVARCRAEKAKRLISPGLIRRIFIQRHNFHTVKMVFLQIRNQEISNLLIAVPAAGHINTLALFLRLLQLSDMLLRVILSSPRTKMKLVDIQRLVFIIRPLLHPPAVMKMVFFKIGDDRGCSRPEFGAERIGIRVIHKRIILLINAIFIHLSRFCIRDKHFPELTVFHAMHRCIRPVIEFSDNAHPERCRCVRAEHNPSVFYMCPQKTVCLKFFSIIKVSKVHTRSNPPPVKPSPVKLYL